MSEFIKTRCTCKGGATVVYPNGTCPPVVPISPQSLSRIGPLVWPAAPHISFLELFARLHVAPATCNRPVYNRHHRLSAAPAHRMNISPTRSDQPFGLQKPKRLDRRTYGQTNIGPTTFLERPTRGNLRAKLNLLLYDFELEAGIAYRIALCQNRRFTSLPRCAPGGIRTHDPSVNDNTM